MNHKRWLLQVIDLILTALLLTACGAPQPTPTPTSTPIPPTPTVMSTPAPTATPTSTPIPTATPTSTPTPTPVSVSISGRAHSTDDPPQAARDRKIVLCLVKEVTREEDEAAVKASCVLDANLTTVTDSEGRFELQGVPDGSYMLLYDDTVEDFEVGLQEWDGKTIKVMDDDWIDQFEDEEGGLPVTSMLNMLLNDLGPQSMQNISLITFLVLYINGFEGFPFLVAAEIDLTARAFTPVIVEVKAGETAEVDFEMFGSKQE